MLKMREAELTSAKSSTQAFATKLQEQQAGFDKEMNDGTYVCTYIRIYIHTRRASTRRSTTVYIHTYIHTHISIHTYPYI